MLYVRHFGHNIYNIVGRGDFGHQPPPGVPPEHFYNLPNTKKPNLENNRSAECRQHSVEMKSEQKFVRCADHHGGISLKRLPNSTYGHTP